MNISQKLDQAADSLDQINWEKVFAELIELRTMLFKGVIVLIVITYVAGETLGTWVHRTNDWLAHQWVRLIVPQTPVETEKAQIIVEEVSAPTTPAIMVEPPLPTAVETMAILFTTPLMLAAAQAPVALLAESQEVTQPPASTKRRRGSAPRSQEVTVTEHEEVQVTKKPSGRKAHDRRVRRTLAA